MERGGPGINKEINDMLPKEYLDAVESRLFAIQLVAINAALDDPEIVSLLSKEETEFAKSGQLSFGDIMGRVLERIDARLGRTF